MTEKDSDIDIRRGTESAPALVLASCFMSVRKLLFREESHLKAEGVSKAPLPQYAFLR